MASFSREKKGCDSAVLQHLQLIVLWTLEQRTPVWTIFLSNKLRFILFQDFLAMYKWYKSYVFNRTSYGQAREFRILLDNDIAKVLTVIPNDIMVDSISNLSPKFQQNPFALCCIGRRTCSDGVCMPERPLVAVLCQSALWWQCCVRAPSGGSVVPERPPVAGFCPISSINSAEIWSHSILLMSAVHIPSPLFYVSLLILYEAILFWCAFSSTSVQFLWKIEAMTIIELV